MPAPAIAKKLGKKAFKAQEDALRLALLDAQFELKEQARASVLLVISGLDGSGKAQVAHRLLGWLDPHLVESLPFGPPTAEERCYPRLWRYWRALPALGRSAIVFGSWYHEPLSAFAEAQDGTRRLRAELRQIASFEALLASEGTACLKIWLDLDEATRARHIEEARGRKGSPRTLMREWEEIEGEDFQRLCRARREMLALTDRAHAPWKVIGAGDPRRRDLAVGEALLEMLQARLSDPRPAAASLLRPTAATAPGAKRIAKLDLTKRLADKDYEAALERLQRRLSRLTEGSRFAGRGLVAVFEGNDAAGKGGAIRRVTAALDPRRFRVIQTGPPDEAARARPWLWRFWHDLPRLGQVAIFDRSWYGRVLVERVEALAEEADWQRAYGEIANFEAQLHASGLILAKFWLAIDKETQRERFEAREAEPYKRFKLTEQDWRNRARWDDYAVAAEEMFQHADRPNAPWTLVPATDKRFARIAVLETLCERLEKGLR